MNAICERFNRTAQEECIHFHCDTCYFSSQLFSSDKRPAVDWELSQEAHRELFREAGFKTLVTIYQKKDSDNWSGLTNQWYFEAR